jgi:hypothetical protein
VRNPTSQLTDIDPFNPLDDVFQLVSEELDEAIQPGQVEIGNESGARSVCEPGCGAGRACLRKRVHVHGERSLTANTLALAAECAGSFPHRADERLMARRYYEIGWRSRSKTVSLRVGGFTGMDWD